ncbi:MAG: antibiotic biosynthesis monooxygenase [Candidatus Melainabacteria bacterium]|nr:antibiotic biosynthesis monooxygenase [Candidatus Melainabacteria bacterium]
MTSSQVDEPITVLVKHFVKPGCQDSFLEWNDGLLKTMRQFKGFIGQTVFPPQEDEPLLYHVIFRFASIDHLQDWWKSDEYRQRRANLPTIVAKQPEFRYSNGLEHWFSTSTAKESNTPPTYKMAVIVYVSLVPLVFIAGPLLQPLLMSFPGWTVTMISTAMIVAIDSYVALPLATRLFAKWLYPV